MLTRRTLLTTAAASGFLLAARLPAAWAASPEQASAFVAQTGQALVGIINSDTPEPAKRAQLASVVDNAVDVDAVARFCLGRFWRTATPAQQQQFSTLFHRVLVDSVTGHLGNYRGVTFTLGRAQPQEGGIAVASTVVRPGAAPAQVQWVVEGGARPRIVDVVAEGTSLRLTQRDDYASFLTSHGGDVQALIVALQRRAAA